MAINADYTLSQSTLMKWKATGALKDNGYSGRKDSRKWSPITGVSGNEMLVEP
jgi:hypothetical protein